MSETSDDKESKTEQATPKKIEKAIEKGQVINSREVSNFILLAGLTILISWVIPFIGIKIFYNLKLILTNVGSFQSNSYKIILVSILTKALLYCSPIFLTIIILPIISSFIQHGQFVFSIEPIIFNLSRISIISGFQRIFSLKAVVELVKNIIKISIISFILIKVIYTDIRQLKLYQDYYLNNIINELYRIILHILYYVTIVVLVIAIIDYFYQRYEYFKSLRMTKEEVKEEYKQTEGNPEIKQRIKTLRLNQIKKNLIKVIPQASVIITNPQHFAIALKYNIDTMNAPIITAKGMNLIALKIKELAEENRIPIVENPLLARALYKEGRINQEIPVHHYEAVAKIISYIYSLQRKNFN